MCVPPLIPIYLAQASTLATSPLPASPLLRDPPSSRLWGRIHQKLRMPPPLHTHTHTHEHTPSALVCPQHRQKTSVSVIIHSLTHLWDTSANTSPCQRGRVSTATPVTLSPSPPWLPGSLQNRALGRGNVPGSLTHRFDLGGRVRAFLSPVRFYDTLFLHYCQI